MRATQMQPRENYQSTPLAERSGRFTRFNRPLRAPSEQAQSQDCVRLSETGFEYGPKHSILARFRPDLQLPMHASEMMSMAEVWVDELLAPLSHQPLSAEEETAMQGGSFVASVRKPHVPNAVGRGASQRERASRGRLVKGSNGGGHLDERNLSRSFETAPMLSHGEGGMQERGGLSGHNAATGVAASLSDFDRSTENDEDLWAMPERDSSLGTFDEQGNFTLLPSHPDPPVMPPPPNAHLSSPPGLPAVLPLITDDTMWYYRDPSGQVQGPFPNKKMLSWHSRDYFPESLPLRREQDGIFEPLSLWKLRCGGLCPFKLAGEDGGTENFGQVASANVKNPNEQTLTKSSIFAKLGLTWTATPPNPQSTFQSTAAPPKSNDQDFTSASKSELAEDQLRFLKQLGVKGQTSSGEPFKPTSLIQERTLREEEEEAKKRVILEGEMSVLGETLRQPSKTQEPSNAVNILFAASKVDSFGRSIATSPPSTMVSPLEIKPAAPPSVSWSKPLASPRPIDEIMREEEQRETARRSATLASTHETMSTSPKTFAEMLRMSEALKSGKASTSIPSPQSSQNATGARPVTVSASRAVAGGATAMSSSQPTAGNASSEMIRPLSKETGKEAEIKAWCLAQLKPLESLYDINTCTILLMELKSSAEVAHFVEDNIKTNKVDMRAFAAEFVQRRFGSTIAAAGSAMPEASREPGEFVTVNRRSRKK